MSTHFKWTGNGCCCLLYYEGKLESESVFLGTLVRKKDYPFFFTAEGPFNVTPVLLVLMRFLLYKAKKETISLNQASEREMLHASDTKETTF